MSGHNKWSTIKRKKGATDAKRGKKFTKIIKEIIIAAKEGGGDPDTNSRLRLAVQNAKGANMPKDNIERAIKKAVGADAVSYIEISFEGYAPHGIAVFAECLTDNNNRTVASIRSAFNKYGGNLGTNGSLAFLFDRKGIFTIKNEGLSLDDIELEMIDAIRIASFLRSKISSHKMNPLVTSLTSYDVENVRMLARRLLLGALGFWPPPWYERNKKR